MRSYFVILLVSFASIFGGWTPRVSCLTPEQRELVDEVVNLYMEQNHVPGLGLTIVENNGANVLSIGYGLSRIESGTPASSQTIFAIGSITKSFTALLAAKVLHKRFPELGEAVLDTPIVKLAPGYNFTLSDRFRGEFASFRDLLSHRTCVLGGGFDLLLGMSNAHLYAYRSRYQAEVCGFRSSWAYNNNLYALAGQLTANIAGVSMEQLFTSFFAQLGMTNTRLADEAGSYEQLPAMSHAYFRKDNVTIQFNTAHLRRLGAVGGAGAILSTATDMAQYVKFYLNKGKVGNTQIVPEEVLNWMYKSASPLTFPDVEVPPLGRTGIYGYGLGFMLGIYEGNPWISHGGYWPPYESEMGLYPEKQFGLFFSKNGPGNTGVRPDQMSQQVLEFLIFEIVHGNLTSLNNLNFDKYKTHPAHDFDIMPPKVSSPIMGKILKGKKSPGRRRAEPEDIVGAYGSPADGEATIVLDADQTLTINFGTWGLGTLSRVSDDVYSIEWISNINDDLYSAGTDTIQAFSIDVGQPDQFIFLADNAPVMLFEKDRLIDSLPIIPWDPNSCGPIVP